MAAARQVLIMCSSLEIDGHAFCLGLGAFKDLISQVAFLIQNSIFRPREISRGQQGRLSLDICSLGELVDMYHAHDATKRHDKIYALLGMCSDDLSAAHLGPDYNLPWMLLMQRLVHFLLGQYISVDTWNERETAVIRSKGCVLGKVSTVDVNNSLADGQNVEAIIKRSSGCGISGSAPWRLRTSAKHVKNGDVICLLKGAFKPTVVRLQEDYFIIIMIAAVPPEDIRTKDGEIEWLELVQSASFIRDFVLVWDWETSLGNTQELGQYNALIQRHNLQPHAGTKLENDMESSIRTWNVAQILGDLGEFSESAEMSQKAKSFFSGRGSGKAPAFSRMPMQPDTAIMDCKLWRRCISRHPTCER